MLITLLIVTELIISSLFLIYTNPTHKIDTTFACLILIGLAFIPQIQLGIICIGIGMFIFATLSFIEKIHRD